VCANTNDSKIIIYRTKNQPLQPVIRRCSVFNYALSALPAVAEPLIKHVLSARFLLLQTTLTIQKVSTKTRRHFQPHTFIALST
jgi:hypothetical protein